MAVLGRTHFPDKSSTSIHMCTCTRVIANATENRDCKRMFSCQFHRLREEKEQAERAYEELEERFRPYRVSVHVILCLTCACYYYTRLNKVLNHFTAWPVNKAIQSRDTDCTIPTRTCC